MCQPADMCGGRVIAIWAASSVLAARYNGQPDAKNA